MAVLHLLVTPLKNLAGGADRATWIEHLSTTGVHVFDHLAKEVLAHVEPELRRFLLQTSILTELTPALCQAVTGRYDSAELLRTIYRRALFCTPTDVTDTAYHYHPLFAEFLRQRLQIELPEQIPVLHCRAADAQLGSERAIAHYLAAGLWQPAAHAISVLGDARIDAGMLETVQGWIAAIPPAVRDAQPWLIYLQGRIAWQRGDFPRAEALLMSALDEFERTHDTAGVDRALVHVAGALTSQYDLVRAQPFVERALSRPIALRDRTRLLQVRAYLYLYQGDWPGVRRDVLAAMSLAKASGELKAYHILLPGLSGFLAHLPGMLDSLEQVCCQALDLIGAIPSPASAAALNLLGYIRLLRGQVAESVQLADRARTMIAQLGVVDPWIGMDQDVLLTYHSLLNGGMPRMVAH